MPRPSFAGLDIRDEKWKLSDAVEIDNEMLSRKLDEFGPEGLSLYEFQKVAVYFMILNRGTCLVCDEMGLGKTIEVIAYWWYDPGPTLVVCPANYKFGWAEEFLRWTDAKVAVVQPGMTKRAKERWERKGIRILDKKSSFSQDNIDILIVNYEHFKAKLDARNHIHMNEITSKIEIEFEPDLMVLDECQRLSKYKSQSNKAAIKMGWTALKILGLTGTPIRNRTSDFFSVLKLINPDEFHDWLAFVMRYCNGRYRIIRSDEWKEVLEYKGTSHWGELAIKLKDFMVRREREQVLPQLPKKTRQIIRVDIDKRYQKTERALYERGVDSFSLISSLRQEAAFWKVLENISLIHDIYKIQNCLVIYYHHKLVGDQLEIELKSYSTGKIDGSIPSHERQELVHQFQSGDLDIMLVSITAGGTGIRLDRCAHGVFVEPEWSPSTVLQAEDRLSSVNQKNPVMIYHLMAADTIDEMFYNQLEDKMNSIGKIIQMDHGAGGGMSEQVLGYLNEKYE